MNFEIFCLVRCALRFPDDVQIGVTAGKVLKKDDIAINAK
jgi:hypothetical protein